MVKQKKIENKFVFLTASSRKIKRSEVNQSQNAF